MLTFRPEQMDQIARTMFISKLKGAFLQDAPGFAELSDDDQREFLEICIATAESKGLKSEQGLASYALGVSWLGLDFDLGSEELSKLLSSDYPEVRKVHAMNEWVQALIGAPDDIAAADQKLKEALESTKAWGN